MDQNSNTWRCGSCSNEDLYAKRNEFAVLLYFCSLAHVNTIKTHLFYWQLSIELSIHDWNFHRRSILLFVKNRQWNASHTFFLSIKQLCRLLLSRRFSRSMVYMKRKTEIGWHGESQQIELNCNDYNIYIIVSRHIWFSSGQVINPSLLHDSATWLYFF